jgi:hypothetical protein
MPDVGSARKLKNCSSASAWGATPAAAVRSAMAAMGDVFRRLVLLFIGVGLARVLVRPSLLVIDGESLVSGSTWPVVPMFGMRWFAFANGYLWLIAEPQRRVSYLEGV